MKSSELPLLDSRDSCAQTVCAACGASFSCGARTSGCWCAEVTLTEKAREELRGRYDGCLCRGCLERFAAVQGRAEP